MKQNNEPSGLYEQIYEGERRKRLEEAQRQQQAMLREQEKRKGGKNRR